MGDLRRYMDLVSEQDTMVADDAYPLRLEVERIRELAGLQEGELIPLPGRVLRIAGTPLDLYQCLKMLSNPNLSHKVNYKPPVVSGKPGANANEPLLIFYDEVSYETAKKVFDHYAIPFADEPELSSELGRQKSPFKSTTKPPDDRDELFGIYYKPENNPL